MRALIIDDDLIILQLLEDILKLYSVSFESFENCQLAWDRLQKDGVFDFALVDWRTPRMNGMQFLKAVREHPKHAKLKIVFVTGLNDLDDVRKALEAGANEYLMKPFTPDMLTSKLRMIGLPVGSNSVEVG